jgi:hypothetical protein
MKERIEPYARRLVRFAVPGPDTTPAEIRRRGRMVAACAFVVIVVASIAYACIGSQQQTALIAAAVDLRKAETCERLEHRVLVVCLPQARWDAAGPRVQDAWLAGQRYTNQMITRIHVRGDDGRTVFDQTFVQARGLGHNSQSAL